MNLIALAGALGGGLVGSLIWGGVTYATNYEIGWIAWGIGALVGFAGALLGGGGSTFGIACGAVALASIFGGKLFAVKLVSEKELSEGFSLQAIYDEYVRDARDFEKVAKADYAKFMVDHDYTDETRASGVSEEEIAYFEEETVPMLKWFADEQPSFDTWMDSEYGAAMLEQREMIREQFNQALIPAVKESLGPLDLIFALLGIATAYKVGSRPREGEGVSTV